MFLVPRLRVSGPGVIRRNSCGAYVSPDFRRLPKPSPLPGRGERPGGRDRPPLKKQKLPEKRRKGLSISGAFESAVVGAMAGGAEASESAHALLVSLLSGGFESGRVLPSATPTAGGCPMSGVRLGRVLLVAVGVLTQMFKWLGDAFGRRDSSDRPVETLACCSRHSLLSGWRLALSATAFAAGESVWLANGKPLRQ